MDFGRLLADHILQIIGSECSNPIREMHFWTFFCFVAFSNRLQAKPERHHQRRRCIKTFFDTSRAQLSQAKPAQVKLGRVDERRRPAGLIHPNTRSPASGGLYWFEGARVS